MLARTLLGAQRGADLAQAMGGAFRQTGLVAAVAEPVAEALGRERLAELGLQKRFFAAGARLDDLLKDRQHRLFGFGDALIARLIGCEFDDPPRLAGRGDLGVDMLLAEPHQISAANAQVKQERECQARLAADWMPVLEGGEVGKRPGIEPVGGVFLAPHVARRIGFYVLGLNGPAEHRRQVFLAVVGRARLAFLGLQIAQPLDLLAGDELQRAVAQRIWIVVGVRFAQAAIDDAPAGNLGLRVEAAEFVGSVILGRQPAQRALGGGNRRGTAIGWRWLRQNFQRRSIGFRKGLRAGLFLDPDAATVAPDIEALVAVAIGF